MKTTKSSSELLKVFFILLFLGFFSYAIIIPWLGFYYDDWPFAWIVHRLGPIEFIDAFKPFRPFLGPYFLISTSILGEIPWMWHIFNFLVRISLSMSCYWALIQVWPKNKSRIFWVAILFFLYPGFNQQWISMTHSNQGMLPHLFQILSFGLMARALRTSSRARVWFILPLISAFVGIFSTEYFISLELLRPIIIWFVLSQINEDRKQLFFQTLRKWIPYLSILILNVIWLIVYQSSGMYDSYRVSVLSQLINNPVQFFQTYVNEFISSFFLSAIEVWIGLFAQLKNPLNAISTYLSLGIAGITFIFLYVFLIRKDKNNLIGANISNFNNPKDNWAIEALLVGGIGVILGKLPSWSIGLPLSNEFPHDRLMMSVMLASSIFFVGLIEWLIVNDRRKTILYLLIVSFAVGHHFTVGNTYRRDWEQQKDFFEQLSWRAPNLEKGTILLTHELPHKYVTDNSLSAALNWVYDSDNYSRELSYMLVYTKARLGSSLLPSLELGTEINYPYRTLNFSSTVDQSLVIYYPSTGCLRLLDPLYTNIEFFPDAPYMLTDAIFLSNIFTITNQEIPTQLPSFFGREDQSSWCFFFQKAELARQNNSWAEIIGIYDQTTQSGLKGQDPSEYLVFVEAFLQMGDFESARSLIQEEIVINGIPANGTCYTLNRVFESINDTYKPAIGNIIQSINCDHSTN